jgi:AcrR family transcriptional regulator
MRNEEVRKRVIKAAVPLLNEYGCKIVTMDSIASLLHISKRTLYETFDNKEALLLECVSDVYRTIGSERLKIIKQTDEPFLMALYITRNETALSIRYSRILRDAEHYYPELTSKLVKLFSDRFKDSLFKVFSEAEAKGDLRPDIDVKDLVETIAMNVRISISNPNNGDKQQSRRIRESCYTFLRGLLSIKAIERYDQNEDKFKKILEAK